MATSGRTVSNDGRAVCTTSDGVLIIRYPQILKVPALAQDAVINAEGRVVVYSVTTYPDNSQSLYVADGITGASRLLTVDGYSPSLSDDGSVVVFLSKDDATAQVWAMGADGTGKRQLTHDTDGVLRARLSGDGKVAYAVTAGGRLLQINVATSGVVELIPRTPFVTAQQLTAPGVLSTFTGAGLAESRIAASPPLPFTLGEIRLTVDGLPSRILEAEPTSISVLTPPEVTPTRYPSNGSTVELTAGPQSPFAGPVTQVIVGLYNPRFLIGAPSRFGAYALAAHEDWSAQVSAEDPARPGEVIHAFASGLGDTTPPVALGDAAPSREPLARVVVGYHCGDFRGEWEILYEGLAPGLAGVYQIDMRVPVGLPGGEFTLPCAVPNGGPSFAGVVPLVDR